MYEYFLLRKQEKMLEDNEDGDADEGNEIRMLREARLKQLKENHNSKLEDRIKVS